MVKIDIVEERDNHVTVLLKETDRAFANALRRTLMSNVPKMAIHRVRFELLKGIVVTKSRKRVKYTFKMSYVVE